MVVTKEFRSWPNFDPMFLGASYCFFVENAAGFLFCMHTLPSSIIIQALVLFNAIKIVL